MFDIDSLAIDLERADGGVRWDLGGGAWILIARWKNKQQAKAINKGLRQLRKRIGNREPTEEEAQEVMAAVIAETIVLDWGGIKTGGKDLPYTKENVKRIFTDPRFDEFQTMVMDFAKDNERYREQSIEEDLGNSESG